MLAIWFGEIWIILTLVFFKARFLQWVKQHRNSKVPTFSLPKQKNKTKTFRYFINRDLYIIGVKLTIRPSIFLIPKSTEIDTTKNTKYIYILYLIRYFREIKHSSLLLWILQQLRLLYKFWNVFLTKIDMFSRAT